jgi:hypothetical protein
MIQGGRMARSKAKRGSERINIKFPVLVRHYKNGTSYKARIVNYSKNGLYIETDKKLMLGAKISLKIVNALTDSSGNINGYYMAKIVWGKILKNSSYNYGYGAIDISDANKTNRKIGDLPTRQELRKHPRKPVFKPVFFYFRKQIMRGFLNNLSRGGACVRTAYNCTTGQIIKLAIASTNIDKGVVLKCEVVHSGQSGIGVKFKSLLRTKEIIRDRGGTRSGRDRRKAFISKYSPEKRSGIDRRNRADRRRFRFVQHPGLKLSAALRDLD